MRGERLLRLGVVSLGTAALIAGALTALDHTFPPDLSRYADRSVELRDAHGTTLNIALTDDGKYRLAAMPEDVSPRYLAMLLAKEDRRFWHHPGVDPLAVVRAVGQLAAHGHVVSGGSTLTMQVARLLMPHRRDFTGKVIEAARAMQLELHYSKRDILAMYLTLAPFGGNLEGVRAASLSYFQHEPNQLTDAEAALLVALPQSPTHLRPDRHPDRALAAATHVLDRTGPEASAAIAFARHALPAFAPHLAERLALQPGPIETTLDAGLQKSVEALATREQPWLGSDANLAALVVRNSDRAILAYLGSSDYFGSFGMVDLVRAHRSPGSALKPFIYGLAFDDAVIVPDTLIDDVPLRIGNYAPRNFDRDFHGTVTARQALQQSYNLPAVEILDRVGPARLVAGLTQSGAMIALPRRDAGPGLPVALGGLAISLEDMTKLYVGLANDGQVAPLRLLRGDPLGTSTALMTVSSAHDIGDILRDTPRPAGVAASQPRAVAYKTGTSYGFRDAWALGYSDRYTVGVWVGRAEGTPRPGAFGINTAAPLLFKIFDLLPSEPPHVSHRSRQPVEATHLAPSLRHFIPLDAPLLGGSAGPRIVYPPAGATIDVAQDDGKILPVALEVSGGRPPYRWMVDGVPLPVPPVGVVMSWTPDGPGFARLSVMDADSRVSSEDLRLE
ncbi:MAG TPA: penicillin-binding protein 1C [Stellaceae bacterium]|jgi:penicillin-binding protein 1C|nr:penicillin-binding protein 1C [Stellaceae bacterium]